MNATIINASSSTKNQDKKRDLEMSSSEKATAARAKVEHTFRIIKYQFAYRKTRNKGIEKNGVQIFSLMGTGKLIQSEAKLLAI